MGNELVTYETGGNEITLSPDTIRRYLVSGDGKVTDQEITMYMALCKMQKLNPFLREVYLIKYSDRFPATMVTGKETFLKRANRNPKYNGHSVGISQDGMTAWAEVHLKGVDIPIRCEVDYSEYVGKNPQGLPNRTWTEKPRTMLKKVALVQALREAFPEDLGGLYSQEEINTVNIPLPENEVAQPKNGKPSVSMPTEKAPDAPKQETKPSAKKENIPVMDSVKPEVEKIMDEKQYAVDYGIVTHTLKTTQGWTDENVEFKLVSGGFLADWTKAEERDRKKIIALLNGCVKMENGK